MQNNFLEEFILDPGNPEKNFNLGLQYEKIGQTAAAISFYLCCADRTEDDELAYESLLHIGECFDRQDNRYEHVRCMYKHAISLLPNRPEAYYKLANFQSWHNQYQDTYYLVNLALKTCQFDQKPFRHTIKYNGKWGLLYEKTMASWHWGKVDEFKSGLLDLINNYWDDMDEYHREKVREKSDEFGLTTSNNIFNTNSKNTTWIVDNFYTNPDAIRKFALDQEYDTGGIGRGYIGNRTYKQFLFKGLKERFEEIMGQKITKWEDHDMNGRFQYCWSGQPRVWHCDNQKWGGMLYLTPDAPYECGTSLYAHKQTKARTFYDDGWDKSWTNVPGDPHLDGTPFEPVDVLGNVYNRLVIFDASCIHSASEYFGTVKENCRLWQMFFFDTES